MKYCSECSHPVSLKIPEGDNRERHVCDQCGAIHYLNPRIIAGCLPIFEHKILLCKRAIEPRKGYWTLPAGFMEQGETLEEGALRETFEEAGFKASIGKMLTTISVPHINQVHVFFEVEMDSAEHAVSTSESLEVAFFSFADIPWQDIAFPTVSKTLKHYVDDVAEGQVRTRVLNIEFEQRLRL